MAKEAPTKNRPQESPGDLLSKLPAFERVDTDTVEFEAADMLSPDDDGTTIHIDTSSPLQEAQDLVAGLRDEMKAVFETELDRVEAAFRSYLGEMQQRLKEADSALTQVAAERDRMRAQNESYEKKWRTLREITTDGL